MSAKKVKYMTASGKDVGFDGIIDVDDEKRDVRRGRESVFT
jgi:hypothetical protein